MTATATDALPAHLADGPATKILAHVREHGATTSKDLAATLGVSTQLVTKVAKDLRGAELLEYGPRQGRSQTYQVPSNGTTVITETFDENGDTTDEKVVTSPAPEENETAETEKEVEDVATKTKAKAKIDLRGTAHEIAAARDELVAEILNGKGETGAPIAEIHDDLAATKQVEHLTQQLVYISLWRLRRDGRAELHRTGTRTPNWRLVSDAS